MTGPVIAILVICAIINVLLAAIRTIAQWENFKTQLRFWKTQYNNRKR